MFGLFKDKAPQCPVSEEMREWIEYAFSWMFADFGEDFCQDQYTFSSLKELLSSYDLEKASFNDIVEMVAKQMWVDMDEIEVTVYEEGEQSIVTDNSTTYIETGEEEVTTGGLYVGKNENGKYEVGIQKHLLQEPITLIYTIAHEFAHIKLLGEKRIERNDELLTDLLPTIFGLGVFGANSVFQYSQSIETWSYRTSGYLTQMEWGYALAVYTWLLDDKNPEWVKSLPKNIQSDYSKSLKYMEHNQELLFQTPVEKK